MRKNRYFWLAAVVGVVVDQVTKYWVTVRFEEIGETIPLWSGVFHFTYVTNTGAAFSLFEGNGDWLRWLSLLVSLALMALGWLGRRLPTLEQWGYGWILAGAIGNGIDRFRLGHVTDFLDFRLIHFPVFNLADVWINIGIVLLIVASLGSSPNPRSRA